MTEQNYCQFCTTNANQIDYKDSELLRKFLTMQAKIGRRHRTGCCAKHQRLLSQAIKRARFLGLIPHTIR
ncbi:30S ribosomal protein S18 [Patescibacteria group bacterium]|nr:30S ribosomal protein S18 [Patescibacteria group bacterium]